MKNQKARRPRPRKTRDCKAKDRSFRFMDLLSVRIGLSDGENQMENETTFVAVAVVSDGD